MEKAVIRPVRLEDAKELNEIRRMDGVRETITGIISERISQSEDFLKHLDDNDHVLVAELAGKVIACAGLHTNKNLRSRHVGRLGIMVHRDFQGNGIGKKLLNVLLDLADNWLLLRRVELDVHVHHKKAIHLYESLGFIIEGTRKYAATFEGTYADLYLMARYRLPE